MMSSPSPSHSPRSNLALGTDSHHPDFLGTASQDDELQELDIFHTYTHDDNTDMTIEASADVASYPSSDFTPSWPSSSGYHSNSLLLLGAAPASSSIGFARPTQPLHDSYFNDDLVYCDTARTLPRIHVDTEFHNALPSSLDPRSPAPSFDRSPTAHMMPTPTSYTHSSPSSSFPPATPQTPFHMSPVGTPYIKQSSSPYSPLISFSPSALTVQPAILEPQDTLWHPNPAEGEEGSHRVLPLAQQWGHPFGGELVPQPDYRPHTQSDRRRYVEQVKLEAPILFFMDSPKALGIPLKDALSSRFMHLFGRDDPMFEGRGPSVSIRLNWPGYAPWSRQIPTRDFRSPPHPVTRAKLARNVAKTIKRFIDEMNQRPMEDDSQGRWRVGKRHIQYEDLMLVGLQHVSMGSWQAHVRLMPRRH